MTICAEWDEVYRLTLFSGCKIEKMWWLKKFGERASAAGRRHLDPLLIMIYNFDGCRWGEEEKCFFGSDTELFLAWCAIIQGGFLTGYAQKVLKMAKSLPKKVKVSVKTLYFPVAYQATTSWFFTVTHCHNSHYFKVRVLCLSVELWDKRFSSIC